ncbi:hypothetical protein RIF29_28856 [Crotalaria pallida]|uniref:Uncharacterized protein n=1 Tax=Crotalaria pallida TaxID=3830 RepID=A0AAN9HZS9_CROPI
MTKTSCSASDCSNQNLCYSLSCSAIVPCFFVSLCDRFQNPNLVSTILLRKDFRVLEASRFVSHFLSLSLLISAKDFSSIVTVWRISLNFFLRFGLAVSNRSEEVVVVS